MVTGLPFLSVYDPPGSTEGTLDPLGLYLIADQLATQLVPAVRERMQRIRFLTAMAVGSLVTEGLDPNPDHPECTPRLAWEWLVVEAIVRTGAGENTVWGVPGTLVTRRALSQLGYLDYRSYLKTPRIFGFHGVYKRLAIRLRLVDTHLSALPEAEQLANAWARDLGLGSFGPGTSQCLRWRNAVERCLREEHVRTRPGWSTDDWSELAHAFLPHAVGRWERRKLVELLHRDDETALGAFPKIWALQGEFQGKDEYKEEDLHRMLGSQAPEYQALLEAIRAYEAFCRSLQDAFDLLRAEAGKVDARGFVVADMAADADFKACLQPLASQFQRARELIGELGLAMLNTFDERYPLFAEPLDAAAFANALCKHHESIQKEKSFEGKRAWFDRLGPDRIYMRQNYRIDRPELRTGRYVHEYRGLPIRRFYQDLT
jgi:hypothetical protein